MVDWRGKKSAIPVGGRDPDPFKFHPLVFFVGVLIMVGLWIMRPDPADGCELEPITANYTLSREALEVLSDGGEIEITAPYGVKVFISFAEVGS